MISCGTTLLLSPVLPELREITHLSPPGLVRRTFDGGLFDRVPSPDENAPPLGCTPAKNVVIHRLQTRSPLSDVTKFYSVTPIEACQNSAHLTSEPSVKDCPTPPQSPVTGDLISQSEYSRGEYSEKPTLPPFDPFADDPAGPTFRLPSKFPGTLSELWPHPRKSPVIQTPTILYTSLQLVSSGFSSPFYPVGSAIPLSWMMFPELFEVGPPESKYFLPKGLLDDEAL